jgi:hypothetical protein
MTAPRKKATEYYQYLSEWPRELGPIPTDADLEQAFALLEAIGKHPRRTRAGGTRQALAVAGYLGHSWDVNRLGEAVAKATRHAKKNTWRNVIKELVDAGLVTRRKQPDGRRNKLSITLTTDGETVVAAELMPTSLEGRKLLREHLIRERDQALMRSRSASGREAPQPASTT